MEAALFPTNSPSSSPNCRVLTATKANKTERFIRSSALLDTKSTHSQLTHSTPAHTVQFPYVLHVQPLYAIYSCSDNRCTLQTALGQSINYGHFLLQPTHLSYCRIFPQINHSTSNSPPGGTRENTWQVTCTSKNLFYCGISCRKYTLTQYAFGKQAADWLAPVVQTSDNTPTDKSVSSGKVVIRETCCVIHWIEIYRAVSVFHRLNNWALIASEDIALTSYTTRETWKRLKF